MAVNNSGYQRNSNISLVARAIWKHKSISRVDLSRELGLYRSTVTNIISFLLENGIVQEGDAVSSGTHGGRRAITLSLRSDFGCVVGFDIQPSHFRAIILSIDGTELWRMDSILESSGLVDKAIEAMELALLERERLNVPLLAVSFSIPGVIDSDNGIVAYSWPFRCEEVDLKTIIEERFGYPVYVENDANAAAWYDINSGILDKNDNALSVVADYHDETSDVGVGVGFATIIKDEVYHGSHHAAGEFVSLSWKSGMNNQSGLSPEILSNPKTDEAAWAFWMDDTFRSIIPLVSVMDFSKVILHGEPYKEKKRVMDFFEEKLPDFPAVLERTGCELVLDTQIGVVSAFGAALRALQMMFRVPSLSEDSPSFANHWEKIIALSSKQRDNG